MGRRLRRPGSPWRLLAHEWTGNQGNGTKYGISHHITDQALRLPESEWRQDHLIEGTEFDELVVSKWLHVEQMDTGSWWMVVGGVVINVRVGRDGRVKHVLVEGPNDNYGPVEGAEYQLVWNGYEDKFTGSEDAS